ncbi:UNVERIFIED_CONTAM: hypothetical protein K2H54_071899 [Gekko kuhli]
MSKEMEKKAEESDPVVIGDNSDDAQISPTSPTSPRDRGDAPSTSSSPRRSGGIKLPKLYCLMGPRNGGAPSGPRRAPPFKFKNTRGSVIIPPPEIPETRQVSNQVSQVISHLMRILRLSEIPNGELTRQWLKRTPSGEGVSDSRVSTADNPKAFAVRQSLQDAQGIVPEASDVGKKESMTRCQSGPHCVMKLIKAGVEQEQCTGREVLRPTRESTIPLRRMFTDPTIAPPPIDEIPQETSPAIPTPPEKNTVPHLEMGKDALKCEYYRIGPDVPTKLVGYIPIFTLTGFSESQIAKEWQSQNSTLMTPSGAQFVVKGNCTQQTWAVETDQIGEWGPPEWVVQLDGSKCDLTSKTTTFRYQCHREFQSVPAEAGIYQLHQPGRTLSFEVLAGENDLMRPRKHPLIGPHVVKRDHKERVMLTPIHSLKEVRLDLTGLNISQVVPECAAYITVSYEG